MRKNVKYASLALILGMLALLIPVISGIGVSSSVGATEILNSYVIIEVTEEKPQPAAFEEEHATVYFEEKMPKKIRTEKRIKKPEIETAKQVEKIELPELSPRLNRTLARDFKPGEEIVFDLGIMNSGDAPTGLFNVKWLLDGIIMGYGGHDEIPARTADENGNSIFEWIALPGSHNLTFIADSDNHVKESDESNNQISFLFSVENYPPDLAPLQIVQEENNSEAIRLRTGIKNIGGTDSGVFNVKWFLDGEMIGYGGHLGMPATGNNSEIFSAEITAIPGLHNVTFIVDADNHVQEWNESNNQAEYIITVV